MIILVNEFRKVSIDFAFVAIDLVIRCMYVLVAIVCAKLISLFHISLRTNKFQREVGNSSKAYIFFLFFFLIHFYLSLCISQFIGLFGKKMHIAAALIALLFIRNVISHSPYSIMCNDKRNMKADY